MKNIFKIPLIETCVCHFQKNGAELDMDNLHTHTQTHTDRKIDRYVNILNNSSFKKNGEFYVDI